MSRSEGGSWGRSVSKKDLKWAFVLAVLEVLGTNMAPSLVLKPVRIGTLWKAPDFQAS